MPLFAKPDTLVYDVKLYGAKGDGVTDDGAAIAAAVTAAGSGGTVYLPPGNYLCGSALSVPNNFTLMGTGQSSRISYSGAGTLITLNGQNQVRFVGLRFSLTTAAASSTLFLVSNTFRCSWSRCIIDGQHTAGTGATYRGQIGIDLEGNAGDNRFVDCDLNNLGVGVQTNTIMNYLVGCVIGTCWRGVFGGDPTGAAFGAGLSVDSCTFVSSAAATDHHVFVNGSGNLFWFTNCWFEGSTTCIEIGVVAGGPYLFGLKQCHLSSTTSTLIIKNCTMANLVDVLLDVDPAQTPTDLTIDATNAVNGNAMNVRSIQVFDLPASTFPPGWTVLGRGTLRFPSVTNGALAVNPQSTSDVGLKLTHQTGSGGDLLQLIRGAMRFKVDSFGRLVIGANNISILAGGNSPNGVTAGDVGSLYLQTNGGAATAVWVKETGSGNTGWVPLNAQIESGSNKTTMGSGAPSGGTSGDYYLRTDTPGTANQRLYVNNAGVWTGIV